MKLLEISLLKDKFKKEREELAELIGIHGIKLEHEFRYAPLAVNILKLEGGDNLDERAIYNTFKGDYDWIHVRLSDAQWKRLGLRDTLYGQSRNVNGTIVTYGRWTNKSKYRNAFRFKEVKNEHVLGMLHEFIHGAEGNMAIAHSFLYGYDRVYTKADEARLKPKRYTLEPSLEKALDWLLNTSLLYKKFISVLSPTLPIIAKIEGKQRKYRYFNENEVLGLDENFIKLLDDLRHNCGFPFIINSGFRTPEKNKEVGGVADSSHLAGIAADIRILNDEQRALFIKEAFKLGITRIGIGQTYCHIDIDKDKNEDRVWLYKNK